MSILRTSAPIGLLCLTSALLLPGCADDPPGNPAPQDSESGTDDQGSDDTGSEDQFFDDTELETILTWLGPLPDAIPDDPSNAWADDPAAATLGQKLFFDAGYSGNGEVSCATCHIPNAAFDDDRANTSEGISFTSRASMSVLNGAFGEAAEETSPWQFWDGRTDSQWAQALAPPEDEIEMGSTRTIVALHVYDTYRAEYEAVFGAMPQLRDGAGDPVAPPEAMPGTAEWDGLPDTVRDDITGVYVNFGKAIAAYERQLISRNSRFDQFWNEIAGGASDSTSLSDAEKAGLRVFIGKGRCLGCHGGRNFTDGQFHNDAVAQAGENVPESDDGRAAGLTIALADEFNCAGQWSDHPDKSRCAVSTLSGAQGELGAFKTPSLRDVANRAPYMHTGMMANLEQVVMHYDLGGAPPGTFAGTRDELMRPLELSQPERQALIAFLFSLSGEPLAPELVTDPR